jgi:hypothetical protein
VEIGKVARVSKLRCILQRRKHFSSANALGVRRLCAPPERPGAVPDIRSTFLASRVGHLQSKHLGTRILQIISRESRWPLESSRKRKHRAGLLQSFQEVSQRNPPSGYLFDPTGARPAFDASGAGAEEGDTQLCGILQTLPLSMWVITGSGREPARSAKERPPDKGRPSYHACSQDRRAGRDTEPIPPKVRQSHAASALETLKRNAKYPELVLNLRENCACCAHLL